MRFVAFEPRLGYLKKLAEKLKNIKFFEAFDEMDFPNLFHTNSDVVNEDYFTSNQDCIAGENEFPFASENNLSRVNDLNLLWQRRRWTITQL